MSKATRVRLRIEIGADAVEVERLVSDPVSGSWRETPADVIREYLADMFESAVAATWVAAPSTLGDHTREDQDR